MGIESEASTRDGNASVRLGDNCIGGSIFRILAVLLAAVVLGVLLACGQPGDDESHQARVSTPTEYDLLESAFHQSNIRVAVGERVEITVEVRQEKHDQHICGVPSVVDPFGNVIQTLTARQNAAQGTATHYVYESQYAFFTAAGGEYGVKLENQGCLLDDVGAVATVQWAVFPVRE